MTCRWTNIYTKAACVNLLRGNDGDSRINKKFEWKIQLNFF